MIIENADSKAMKFKNPERLLVVVIAAIFWSIGFIDLLGHTSATPAVLGLYSLPFFAAILLYGLCGVFWIVLFVSPKILVRLVEGIEVLQRKTWLVLAILAGSGLALWIILEWDRWTKLPGLQLTAFFLVILTVGILIFLGWRENKNKQWWRKVIGYPLLALVALELLIQGVAWLGILPGAHMIGGKFVPYERIYYNAEGFRNGIANRYGWYYPDSSLDDEGKRIIIFGTSRVLAMQMPPEQQFGTLLSELINQSRPEDDVETQIITMGLPGFGPGPYLYDAFMQEITGPIKPDEVIILIDLGDDFQSASPANDDVVYTVDDTGTVNIDEVNANYRHDLSHFFLRSYYSFQFVETIRSHYLTPKVIGGFAQSWGNRALATSSVNDDFNIPRLKGVVTDHFALTESAHAGITATSLEKTPNGNTFMFKNEENDEARKAVAIVASMLKLSNKYATPDGYTLRVVTIPAFPRAFYTRFQADDWEPVIAEYDLFLPERALSEIAQNESIPFLAMGQQMYEDTLTVDDIKDFYYSDGQGHFTPAGHKYFAEAIFSCFFAQDQKSSPVACDTH